MFFCLVAIGGLGFASGTQVSLATGILLVVSTLFNMITVGPVCYPILAETLSGRSRYKTIVIGRFVYNLTGLFSNSVTPCMLSLLDKFLSFSCPLFSNDVRFGETIALTNSLPGLELGRQGCSLLRRNQSPLQHLVLVQTTRN